MNTTTTGQIASIHISDGGVPKMPVDSATVRTEGIVGDAQNDTRHHGGPERAVCLLGLEVIEALRSDGHPIQPGATGENVTVSGLHWQDVTPGARLQFANGVVLEVASYTKPCSTIKDAFRDGEVSLINQELHAGRSRVYARVIAEGDLTTGEQVTLLPASGGAE